MYNSKCDYELWKTCYWSSKLFSDELCPFWAMISNPLYKKCQCPTPVSPDSFCYSASYAAQSVTMALIVLWRSLLA